MVACISFIGGLIILYNLKQNSIIFVFTSKIENEMAFAYLMLMEKDIFLYH